MYPKLEAMWRRSLRSAQSKTKGINRGLLVAENVWGNPVGKLMLYTGASRAMYYWNLAIRCLGAVDKETTQEGIDSKV